MRHRFTQRFSRQYAEAPLDIQGAFDRRLELLLQNLRHPSLRAKKYDEATDIWQARVTRGWRFYFPYRGGHVRDSVAHPPPEVRLSRGLELVRELRAVRLAVTHRHRDLEVGHEVGLAVGEVRP